MNKAYLSPSLGISLSVGTFSSSSKCPNFASHSHSHTLFTLMRSDLKYSTCLVNFSANEPYDCCRKFNVSSFAVGGSRGQGGNAFKWPWCKHPLKRLESVKHKIDFLIFVFCCLLLLCVVVVVVWLLSAPIVQG